MTGAPALDPWPLSILVCPLTRTPLQHDIDAHELISNAAGLAYPIRQGVPVMLVDQARQIKASNSAPDDIREQSHNYPDSRIESQPEA